MVEEKGIKLIQSKNGKLRYQAIVYYERKFVCSKTFDSLTLAKKYKKTKYEDAVRGITKPAAVRREERAREKGLNRPMSQWAEQFVQANVSSIGRTRLNEYLLVGRLIDKYSLKDFQGKHGEKLIDKLATEWQYLHFTTGMRGSPLNKPGQPIAAQTLRLRLTALQKLIKFAIRELPDGITFARPDWENISDKPSAHAGARTRLPSDSEYEALLAHIGVDSDLGQLLQVIDDTGCRLGEVLNACGRDIELFADGSGALAGGKLTLPHHKTDKYIGLREVPLSLHAAQILKRRKDKYGNGKLFVALGKSDDVCKRFRASCKAKGITNLFIKDFRRGFITRSARALSDFERAKIWSSSSLDSPHQPDNSCQQVSAAVGHTRQQTTVGYFQPEWIDISKRLTNASRWSKVSNGATERGMWVGREDATEIAANRSLDGPANCRLPVDSRERH